MKYSGLVLLLIIAVSVYLSWDKIGTKQYMTANSTTSIADLQDMVSKTSVQDSQKAKAFSIKHQVDVIAAYNQSAAKIDTNLIALAPIIPAAKHLTVTLPKQRYIPYTKVTPKHYKNYEVSMIFISPNNRYAVVDGHFSRVGDVLPDGGKVVAIEESHVEVKHGKKVRTYKIHS